MTTHKTPQRADKPSFNGEECWETMEIQATLREWHRTHVAPRNTSRGSGVETLPGIRKLSPSDSPERAKRHWWLLWRRRPA